MADRWRDIGAAPGGVLIPFYCSQLAPWPQAAGFRLGRRRHLGQLSLRLVACGLWQKRDYLYPETVVLDPNDGAASCNAQAMISRLCTSTSHTSNDVGRFAPFPSSQARRVRALVRSAVRLVLHQWHEEAQGAASGRGQSLIRLRRMLTSTTDGHGSSFFICVHPCPSVVQRNGLTSDDQSLMQTFFASVKNRSASTPPSRPTPLCFTPPNGVRRSRTIQQFTHTIPVFSARDTR
jgi:hypothetical protein